MWFSDEQLRALAIGAIRTQCDEASHEWPGGDAPTASAAHDAKKWLREEEIEDGDELVIEARAQLDASTSLSLGHAVNLAGNAWLAGWIDDEALWSIAFEARDRAFQRFDSWAAFGRAHGEDCDPHEDEVKALLTESTSPWVRFAWGTKEPRAKKQASHARSHPAAPRNRAERFSLGLRGAWGVAEHALLDFLGGVALLPRTSGSMLNEFIEQNRDRDTLVDVISSYIDPGRATRDLASSVKDAKEYDKSAKVRAAVDADAVRKAFVDAVREKGAARVTRALQAYCYANAAELINRAFVAGVLQEGDCWDLLLRAARGAQRGAKSWVELYDLVAETMALRNGEKEPPNFCIVVNEAMKTRDDSPLRHVPWDTNLDADEPIEPPTDFLCIAIKLSVECPSCRTHAHVDRFLGEVTCEGCGATTPISANEWKLLLADPIDYGRKTRDGVWRNRIDHGERFRSQVTWATKAPACARCDSPLDLASLSDRSFSKAALVCASCGEVAHAERPRACLVDVDPLLVATVGELGDERVTRDAPLPLVVPCVACGASMNVDGSERVPSCPSCAARNGLSADLWTHFHPEKTRRTIYLVLPKTMAPVDLPTPSPGVATTEGLRFASLWDEYNGLYGLNANLDAPTLAPEPVLTRAQQFALSLGAVDRHVNGLDHARIAGVPRSVGYRVLAAMSLRKEWRIGGSDAWRESLAKVPKNRPLVDRLRRQHHLLRLGYLAGFIDEAEFFSELAPLTVAAREQFSSFAELAAAHQKVPYILTSDGALKKAAGELLSDPCSPWNELDWNKAPDDQTPMTWSGPLDWVRVRLSVTCAECLANVPVDDMAERARCPKCHAPFDLTRDTWRERLEQVVFVTKQLERGVLERTSDHRYDGTWSIELVREAPRCDGCQATLRLEDDAATCGNCGLSSTIRPANQRDREIDPRLSRVLARGPSRAPSTLAVACVSCGAALAADGTARILTCAHCHARVWLRDKDWLLLHPVARRRGFYFGIRANRTTQGPKDALDGEGIARSFLVFGSPATVSGFERIPWE